MKYQVSCLSDDIFKYANAIVEFNGMFFTMKPDGFEACTFAMVKFDTLDELMKFQKEVDHEISIDGKYIMIQDEIIE